MINFHPIFQCIFKNQINKSDENILQWYNVPNHLEGRRVKSNYHLCYRINSIIFLVSTVKPIKLAHASLWLIQHWGLLKGWRQHCRDPSPWWHVARLVVWSDSIWTPQRGTRGTLPYPDSLREKHTALANITPWMIAYPIRICCPDHWLKWASLATSFRQLATAHVPPPSYGVSGRPVRTSLPWIPKNFPQSRIALVIKKLSKHQNLTQFD